MVVVQHHDSKDVGQVVAVTATEGDANAICEFDVSKQLVAYSWTHKGAPTIGSEVRFDGQQVMPLKAAALATFLNPAKSATLIELRLNRMIEKERVRADLAESKLIGSRDRFETLKHVEAENYALNRENAALRKKMSGLETQIEQDSKRLDELRTSAALAAVFQSRLGAPDGQLSFEPTYAESMRVFACRNEREALRRLMHNARSEWNTLTYFVTLCETEARAKQVNSILQTTLNVAVENHQSLMLPSCESAVRTGDRVRFLADHLEIQQHEMGVVIGVDEQSNVLQVGIDDGRVRTVSLEEGPQIDLGYATTFAEAQSMSNIGRAYAFLERDGRGRDLLAVCPAPHVDVFLDDATAEKELGDLLRRAPTAAHLAKFQVYPVQERVRSAMED